MAYLYYMKKLFFAISLFLFSVTAAIAQKDSLQFDESNKYVYYQVAEKPGMSSDTLYNRGIIFLKSIQAKSVNKTSPNNIISRGKFMVYGNALVSKKEAGEVAYQLNIDTKEGKYRYKFSGFVFTPYKIDRFGSMVAVPGIAIPAEKLSSKYNKKESEAFLDQIATFCIAGAKQLSSYMDKIQAPKTVQPVKKVITDKW
ncbi:hypothetical protein A0256_18390 [Mucilaginibacter sp. PAMC 26640]|nr:hypothetical protein A0256_18390 [Mucilaginibacter sp. PAMC 26640]